MSEPLRVYADTSVFGGPFDIEFRTGSLRFFQLVDAGRIRLLTSAVVSAELQAAPAHVRSFFDSHATKALLLDVSREALELQEAYIAAGILTQRWADDALHVALAAVARCDAIVSWNFTHIVNFRRIPLFSAVNALRGLPPLRIHTPPELAADDPDPPHTT